MRLSHGINGKAGAAVEFWQQGLLDLETVPGSVGSILWACCLLLLLLLLLVLHCCASPACVGPAIRLRSPLQLMLLKQHEVELTASDWQLVIAWAMPPVVSFMLECLLETAGEHRMKGGASCMLAGVMSERVARLNTVPQEHAVPDDRDRVT